MIRSLLKDTWTKIEDGIWRLSAPRSFAWPEAEYTERQGLTVRADPIMGRTLRGLVEGLHADTEGPALEIGCGTGALTTTLACDGRYSQIIASDISVEFLKITRNNLKNLNIDDKSVIYATLAAEDIKVFRPESLSAVFLASALHHIEDWKGFLKDVHLVLRPGGIVYFKEPCIGQRYPSTLGETNSAHSITCCEAPGIERRITNGGDAR